jgi:hypothetical protein
MNEMPDWLRRSLRTWLQVFVATLAASLTTASLNDVAGFAWWQKALGSAALSAGVALLSAIASGLQNAAEDKGLIKPFLYTRVDGKRSTEPTKTVPGDEL